MFLIAFIFQNRSNCVNYIFNAFIFEVSWWSYSNIACFNLTMNFWIIKTFKLNFSEFLFNYFERNSKNTVRQHCEWSLRHPLPTKVAHSPHLLLLRCTLGLYLHELLISWCFEVELKEEPYFSFFKNLNYFIFLKKASLIQKPNVFFSIFYYYSN